MTDNDEEMVAYLRAARTHTPEEDAENTARLDKYHLTPQEWLESHSHEPYAAAA